MSTATLDVTAVRARFSALDRPLAFFDGPGGTQCPDAVIDAIADYLRESNANIGAPYETSRRTDELVERSRAERRVLPRVVTRRGRVRPEHDGAQLPAHARVRDGRSARATRSSSRSSTTTRTWRRGSSSPTTSASSSASQGSPTSSRSTTTISPGCSRTARASSAFPVAANSVGTAPDVRRIVELAHGAGALAWADAVHYGPHGPIDVDGLGRRRPDLLALQVLRAASRARVRKAGAARVLAAVQGSTCRERARRAPLRARDAPARAPRGVRRGRRLRRLARLGRDPGPRDRSRRAVSGRASRRGRALRPADDERARPDVLLQPPGPVAREVATLLAERDLAVWHGNYYSLETMRHLGLDGRRGARGDRALQHRGRGRPPARRARRPRVKLLVLGGPRFLGRAIADAALAARARADVLQPRADEPGALPGGGVASGRSRGRARTALRGSQVGRGRRHVAATSPVSFESPSKPSPNRAATASCRASPCTPTSAWRSTRRARWPSSTVSRTTRSRIANYGRAEGALRGGGARDDAEIALSSCGRV